MYLPVKNGWPWSSIIKMNVQPSSELFQSVTDRWNSIDWGDNYENYRMPDDVTNIKDYRRSITWVNAGNQKCDKVQDLAYKVFEDVKDHFPEEMRMVCADISLLLPRGELFWHHDRGAIHKYCTRIMLPITDGDEIDYYFSSWKPDTPSDNTFVFDKCMDDDIVKLHMSPGQYYVYNHRIPHRVVSNSDKPRGLFLIDVMPARLDLSNIIGKYEPISDEEKIRIEPSNIQ